MMTVISIWHFVGRYRQESQFSGDRAALLYCAILTNDGSCSIPELDDGGKNSPLHTRARACAPHTHSFFSELGVNSRSHSCKASALPLGPTPTVG